MLVQNSNSMEEAHAQTESLRALVRSIQDMNPTVSIQGIATDFDIATALATGQFTTVVFCNAPAEVLGRLAPMARASLTKLVACSLHGLAARIFTDVGPAHSVLDATGEQPATCAVTAATQQGAHITVEVAPDTPHGLQAGDSFTLRGVQGALAELCGPPLVVLETPSRCAVVAAGTQPPAAASSAASSGAASPPSTSACGGFLVAQPRTAQVAGYSWATASSLALAAQEDALQHAPQNLLAGAMVDFGGCPLALHLALGAAEVLAGGGGRGLVACRSWEAAVTEEAQARLEELLATPVHLRLTVVPNDIQEQLPGAVGAVCMAQEACGELPPLTSIVGGLSAHEVVKTITGQHVPHAQWWSVDFSSLPAEAPVGGGSPLQALLGAGTQEKLDNARVFIVGAGAIGCEWIKLLAALGACTGPDGHLTITDMDTIEMSNLSRQFLFRAEHVKQPKSVMAAQAAQGLNPALAGHVTARTEAVSRRNEHIFDDAFWQSQDIIITALDNVDARLYVDSKCVQFCKPMFDSGTVGAKGSMQVVLPFLTENYGATKDPPQTTFPVCTLKNFPYRIEHTLQWAQDWFHGELCSSLQYARSWLASPGALLGDVPHSARLQAARRAADTLQHAPLNLADCIIKARTVFQVKLHDDLSQLLHQYPADMQDEAGTPFWSGTKRAPTPAVFDQTSDDHIDFVCSLAGVFADAFGISRHGLGPPVVQAALQGVTFGAFSPDGSMVIPATEEEAAAQAEAAARAAPDSLDAQVAAALQDVPAQLPAGLELHPLHFDKDDDSMMQAVAAVSNMRAACYGIPPQDLHASRRIAGNIIPAIATTTAVVAGLAAMEMLRYLAGELDVSCYRCAFLNMALPLFMLSEPVPCPVAETVLAAGVQFVPPRGGADMQHTDQERTWRWSLWDCVQVQHPATLGELLEHVRSSFNLEVCMLNYGVASLYSDLMSTPARLEKKKARTIPELIASVTGEALPPDTHSVELLTICVDGEDNEVEIPTIKYIM